MSCKGHECLSFMMPYSSYRMAMFNETAISYDIMRDTRTLMGWMLGGVQACTSQAICRWCVKFDIWDVIHG
jgi:hypothetical protein